MGSTVKLGDCISGLFRKDFVEGGGWCKQGLEWSGKGIFDLALPKAQMRI